MTIKQLLVIPLLLPINFIAGCTLTHVTYTDPVAYCAAVNTVDRPGYQYVGPASPEWVEDAMARELHLGPVVSNPGLLPIVWRCADGMVVGCSIGFGMPCDERVDTSRVPTRAILDFCRAFPDDNRPLPILDGQLSAYTWGCRTGWPHIIGVRRDLDAQGYPRRYWLLVKPSGAFSA